MAAIDGTLARDVPKTRIGVRLVRVPRWLGLCAKAFGECRRKTEYLRRRAGFSRWPGVTRGCVAFYAYPTMAA
jgi:hypothetical protein